MASRSFNMITFTFAAAALVVGLVALARPAGSRPPAAQVEQAPALATGTAEAVRAVDVPNVARDPSLVPP
ncbi:MAG: hypothetical protein ACRDG5_01470, partial [Anaerolineales bacterium]